MLKKTVFIFLIQICMLPAMAASKSSTTELCDKLVKYYVDIWHQHQQLAREIQSGGLWPPEANEARLNLFYQLDKYLMTTARQLERNQCVIPDDAIDLSHI